MVQSDFVGLIVLDKGEQIMVKKNENLTITPTG